MNITKMIQNLRSPFFMSIKKSNHKNSLPKRKSSIEYLTELTEEPEQLSNSDNNIPSQEQLDIINSIETKLKEKQKEDEEEENRRRNSNFSVTSTSANKRKLFQMMQEQQTNIQHTESEDDSQSSGYNKNSNFESNRKSSLSKSGKNVLSSTRRRLQSFKLPTRNNRNFSFSSASNGSFHHKNSEKRNNSIEEENYHTPILAAHLPGIRRCSFREFSSVNTTNKNKLIPATQRPLIHKLSPNHDSSATNDEKSPLIEALKPSPNPVRIARRHSQNPQSRNHSQFQFIQRKNNNNDNKINNDATETLHTNPNISEIAEVVSTFIQRSSVQEHEIKSAADFLTTKNNGTKIHKSHTFVNKFFNGSSRLNSKASNNDLDSYTAINIDEHKPPD